MKMIWKMQLKFHMSTRRKLIFIGFLNVLILLELIFKEMVHWLSNFLIYLHFY